MSLNPKIKKILITGALGLLVASSAVGIFSYTHDSSYNPSMLVTARRRGRRTNHAEQEINQDKNAINAAKHNKAFTIGGHTFHHEGSIYDNNTGVGNNTNWKEDLKELERIGSQYGFNKPTSNDYHAANGSRNYYRTLFHAYQDGLYDHVANSYANHQINDISNASNIRHNQPINFNGHKIINENQGTYRGSIKNLLKIAAKDGYRIGKSKMQQYLRWWRRDHPREGKDTFLKHCIEDGTYEHAKGAIKKGHEVARERREQNRIIRKCGDNNGCIRRQDRRAHISYHPRRNRRNRRRGGRRNRRGRGNRHGRRSHRRNRRNQGDNSNPDSNQSDPAEKTAEEMNSTPNEDINAHGQKKLPFSDNLYANRLIINSEITKRALEKGMTPQCTAGGPSAPNWHTRYHSLDDGNGSDNGYQAIPSNGGPDANHSQPHIKGIWNETATTLGTYHESLFDYASLQNWLTNSPEPNPFPRKDNKDFYIKLPKNQPNANYKITIKYPEQAKYNFTSNDVLPDGNDIKGLDLKRKGDNGKLSRRTGYLTPVLTISNIKYYHPWYGNSDERGSKRSIQFSQAFSGASGMFYNGVTSLRVNLTFEDSSKSDPSNMSSKSTQNVKDINDGKVNIPSQMINNKGGLTRDVNGNHVNIISNGKLTDRGLNNSYIDITDDRGIINYKGSLGSSNTPWMSYTSHSNEIFDRSFWKGNPNHDLSTSEHDPTNYNSDYQPNPNEQGNLDGYENKSTVQVSNEGTRRSPKYKAISTFSEPYYYGIKGKDNSGQWLKQPYSGDTSSNIVGKGGKDSILQKGKPNHETATSSSEATAVKESQNKLKGDLKETFQSKDGLNRPYLKKYDYNGHTCYYLYKYYWRDIAPTASKTLNKLYPVSKFGYERAANITFGRIQWAKQVANEIKGVPSKINTLPILFWLNQPNEIHFGYNQYSKGKPVQDETDPTGNTLQTGSGNNVNKGEYSASPVTSIRTYHSKIFGTATGGKYQNQQPPTFPSGSPLRKNTNSVIIRLGNQSDAEVGESTPVRSDAPAFNQGELANGVIPQINVTQGAANGYGSFSFKTDTPIVPPRSSNIPQAPQKKQKVVTDIHHETINYQNHRYHRGGILKFPGQKYNYKVMGTMPAYNQKLDYDGANVLLNRWNDNRDHFDFYDKLPPYVSLTGDPYMLVNGKKVATTAGTSGTSSNIHMQINGGNNSKMVNLSAKNYTIVIPVQANKLPDAGSINQNWLKFANQAHTNYTIHSGPSGKLINNNNTRYTNKIPVQIKRVKVTDYHYDYNHNENINDNYFPDKEEPFGFDGTDGNHTTINPAVNPDTDKSGCSYLDPNNKGGYGNKTKADKDSLNYKEYRYHKYFVTGLATDGNTDKNHDVLAQNTAYHWVGSNYGVHFLNDKYKDGHKAWMFRAVYPGVTSGDMNSEPDFSSLEQHISNDWCNGDKEHLADSYQGHEVSVRTNPDYGNAYTQNKGFSQINYFPYIVPRINMPSTNNGYSGNNPRNTPSKNPNNPDSQNNATANPYKPKDGRVVIDTDKKDHGLPFRVNMRVQNFLQGRHYFEDFDCDDIEMKITSNGVPLYDKTRPLLDKKSQQGSDNTTDAHEPNEALAHLHNGYKQYSNGGEGFTQHDITNDEWPKGDHTWQGYIEKDAFKEAEARQQQYNLNTSGVHDGNGADIPIKVEFIPHNTCGQPIERVDAPTINSYAHLASETQVRNRSFNGNNKKIYKEPERTIQYYGQPETRVLYELFGITQPRNGYAKTGFGMTSNDFGMFYMGHLLAHHYAHYGTSLDYAFPQRFNSKDSNIEYSKDPREHHANGKTMLVDGLLHVQPSEYRTDTRSKVFNNPKYDHNNGENNNLPKGLDNMNDDRSDVETDIHFDKIFPEGIDAGVYRSTYGFYPRKSYHNAKGIDQKPEGEVAIANGNDPKPYNHHSSYRDSKVSGGSYTFKANGKHGAASNTTYNKQLYHNSAESIINDGQNERMFTPRFMMLGKYPVFFEKAFKSTGTGSRAHRLGGNFFDIDEDRPIHFYAHEYIAKNSRSKNQDEFSLQPILTDPHGLNQVSSSSPLFPKKWLKDADANDGIGNSWKSLEINTGL